MEKQNKIGYLGPSGSFTEVAVKNFFKNECFQLCPFQTIPDCLQSIDLNELDYVVVPIENSIGGPVHITVDWLIHEVNIPIQGEVKLPIDQDLLIHPKQREGMNNNKDRFQKILSHPQAILQCSRYIRKNYPKIEIQYTNSTAEAARIISENPDEPLLAIANSIAKDIYQLETLKKAIQDYPNNLTRFVVLGKKPYLVEAESKDSKYKQSLLLALPMNDLMMLHKVLGIFTEYEIKLTRMDSAPMKTGMGNYYFFIDIDTNNTSDLTLPFNEIEQLGYNVRQLGRYPCKLYTEKLSS